MSRTVFYSWQSDSLGKTNRNFIENALQAALINLHDPDNELVESERPTLDKDTQGLPGSPAIADAIFEKIANCAVFVPDLTYIGDTPGGRKISNPNVLIEYGLALSKVGDGRIVAVMNEAFGSPREFDLPFDLIHKRWPITYYLTEDASPEERKQQKARLVKILTEALRSCLATVQTEDTATNVWLSPSDRPTSFVNDGEVLGPYRARAFDEDTREVRWKGGPQWSLQVRPMSPLPNLSRSRLEEITKNGSLVFLNARSHSLWRFPNDHGFCQAYTRGDYNSFQAEEIVQLTTAGEIWAIDTNVIVRDRKATFFPEIYFAGALASYLQFYQTALGYEGRVSVCAGFSGLMSHRMLPPELSGGYSFFPGEEFGPFVVDKVVWEVNNIDVVPDPAFSLEYDLVRYSIPFLQNEGDTRTPLRKYAYGVLAPFFEQWWDALGVERLECLPRPSGIV